LAYLHVIAVKSAGVAEGRATMRIAIADRDMGVVQHLTPILQELGYEVAGFVDSQALAQALLKEQFDLLILDLNMPADSGGNFFPWVQKNLPEPLPVMIMASRSAKRDITDALNSGADDYITKPEDRSVIAARVNAVLRGASGFDAFDVEATYGVYTLNRLDQSVAYRDQTVFLTAKELELAEMFFKNADRTLSRNYIMETIWRTKASLATRTLDMHISRVRAKLNLRPDNGFRIFTVFGYGYRLETISR
jgi:DNA-binding response OmpR family regulator